jgi:hypothetical protein
MSELSKNTNMEELLDKLRKTMKANNELLRENNELQRQVLEKLKKKKRCKNCKKD